MQRPPFTLPPLTRLGKPPSFLPGIALHSKSVHCPIEVPPQYVQPYAHLDPNRRMFAGMLAAMDEAVGSVADGLRAKGMYDNTLIVFTTDVS